MSLLIASSAGLGLTLTVLLIPCVLRSGLMRQRACDWHHGRRARVPRLGGVVLVMAFLAVEAWIRVFHPQARANTPGRDLVVLASLATFALGFGDDLYPLSAVVKLSAQVLIATAVWVGGMGIEFWKTPLDQTPVYLGTWGLLLTVVWLVGLTNLINLADGVDGVAGGLSLMLMLLLAVVAHQHGGFELMVCGVAGALLGFLCFNLPPARIYLGDGGAYFLGFQVGMHTIVNSHHGTVFDAWVAPLFVLALPMTDAAITLARRGLTGLPILRADRKHLHHRLLSDGRAHRQVLLRISGVNLLFLLLGSAAFWSPSHWLPMWLGFALLLLVCCALSCGFSRRWFKVHRVLRSSLAMRGQVQYTLSLVRWLELESQRRAEPAELWPGLVFAAEKLGFASLKLDLRGAQRVWHRHAEIVGAVQRRFECPNDGGARLVFSAPACPFGPPARGNPCEEGRPCSAREGGCVSNPRVFELISELLAEAWAKAEARSDRFRQRDFDARQPAPPARTPALYRVPFARFLLRIPRWLWLGCIVGIWLAGNQGVCADVESALRTARPPELPEVAARLVVQAGPQARALAAKGVVASAVRINPSATLAVVGAVVRAAPDQVADVCAAAVGEQPLLAAEIARTAAALAPGRAHQIVSAAARSAPAQCRDIALAVARVSPAENRDVLLAVGEVRTDLAPYLARELARFPRTRPPVARCLDNAERAHTATLASRPAPNPGPGPGPAPVRPSPPGQSGGAPPRGGADPPGGRNYARP